MHIEGDEQLRGLYHFPNAHIHNAVVAHQPPQRHIEALQSRCFQIAGQTACVGLSAVSLAQLVV